MNCWNGDAPSILAASYTSSGNDCIRARINKKERGKYLQISKAITIDKAKGNLNT